MYCDHVHTGSLPGQTAHSSTISVRHSAVCNNYVGIPFCFNGTLVHVYKYMTHVQYLFLTPGCWNEEDEWECNIQFCVVDKHHDCQTVHGHAEGTSEHIKVSPVLGQNGQEVGTCIDIKWVGGLYTVVSTHVDGGSSVEFVVKLWVLVYITTPAVRNVLPYMVMWTTWVVPVHVHVCDDTEIPCCFYYHLECTFEPHPLNY